MYKPIVIVILLWSSVSFSLEIIKIKPIRQAGSIGVLGDIESHMPARNQYQDSDRTTSAHEQCHGLCSRLRKQYSQYDEVLYILQNNAVGFMDDKNVTLARISQEVPRSIRGNTYNLYLVQQQRYWNRNPTYVLEEMVCYVNGTHAGIDYKMVDRAGFSLGNASQLMGAALVFAKLSPSDTQLRDFLHLYCQHICLLCGWAEANGITHQNIYDFYDKLCQASDCKDLRKFCIAYFGEAYSRVFFGIGEKNEVDFFPFRSHLSSNKHGMCKFLERLQCQRRSSGFLRGDICRY